MHRLAEGFSNRVESPALRPGSRLKTRLDIWRRQGPEQKSVGFLAKADLDLVFGQMMVDRSCHGKEVYIAATGSIAQTGGFCDRPRSDRIAGARAARSRQPFLRPFRLLVRRRHDRYDEWYHRTDSLQGDQCRKLNRQST
jgi:hypothetical protein